MEASRSARLFESVVVVRFCFRGGRLLWLVAGFVVYTGSSLGGGIGLADIVVHLGPPLSRGWDISRHISPMRLSPDVVV